MKIKTIQIHNFRSIKDVSFNLENYTVLVGANNSGKSNILTALRIFYEDGIKFNEKIDFPKFQTDDNESWIEIEYKLTNDEFKNLKNEYKSSNNKLKVRKYLKSDDSNKVKFSQSNIYAYENGKLSSGLFYGAKNISQAKLGNVIYIPELAKTEDTLKLSGPSPLRNTLTFVMKKVIKTSKSFNYLTEAFDSFNNAFKEEVSKDGISLERFRDDINYNLKNWGVKFTLNINPVKPEDIIKNLISYSFIDQMLEEKEIDVNLYGQGLQRHLIYTLIRISSKYKEQKKYGKKEFSPDLTLILFEEPESFLHPMQQEYLNSNLQELASEEEQQIIITTHSPLFVSKNIEDISSLTRLQKNNGISESFQISEDIKNNILERNNKLIEIFKNALDDNKVDNTTKNRIKKLLGNTKENIRIEEDAIRYSLWLNSERSSCFFANIVLICEGATEKTFIDYLIKNKWKDLWEKKIYVLDAMGKFNIHKYMNFFNELGIHHSVLLDKDEDSNVHRIINQFIEENKNDYTKEIYFFDKDIESFLSISKPPSNRMDKKPLNVMWHYKNGKIDEQKIIEFKKIIEQLI